MRTWSRRESGASLVEVGIVLPLLMVMAIGLSEVGFLVVDYLTANNAAREGARVGASAANIPSADDLILNSVEEAACNLTFGSLDTVTIFKADADGEIPVPPGTSVNVYTNSGGLLCDAPGHGLSCSNGCPWAPTSRDRIPDPSLDVLGVEVIFSHSSVTGFFPFPTVSWAEAAVMTIEPDTRVQQ